MGKSCSSNKAQWKQLLKVVFTDILLASKIVSAKNPFLNTICVFTNVGWGRRTPKPPFVLLCLERMELVHVSFSYCARLDCLGELEFSIWVLKKNRLGCSKMSF